MENSAHVHQTADEAQPGRGAGSYLKPKGKMMSTQQSAGIRVPYELVPTTLAGAFITPAPPDDFDPSTESPAALIKHGFLWRRPGQGDDPGLRTAWERAFSRRWRAEDRLVPELEPQVGKTHNLRSAKRAADGTFTGGQWAGSVVPGKWTGAIGYWVIPAVTEPLQPQGTEGGWNSSSWVGIDGFGSDDVLQAGVQQEVDTNGNAHYVAWFEWYAPPQSDSPGYVFQTNIPNFMVSPGQTVYCSEWEQIGSPGATFVVTADTVFGLSPDRQAVWQYDGTGASWTQVGGPAAEIVAVPAG
jgi:Peptidase A4 family